MSLDAVIGFIVVAEVIVGCFVITWEIETLMRERRKIR